MSLRRRASAAVAIVLGSAALLVAALQPAIPQARGKGPAVAPTPTPAPARVGGVASIRNGDTILFTSPQFVVQALWIKSNDETGWYWTGSDEVYAVFSDMAPTSTDRTTSEYELDEGDTVNFNATDSCMAPQPKCDAGMAEVNVSFSFWESDWAAPLGFSHCVRPDKPGIRFRVSTGVCIDDDFIGEGAIIHSALDLIAMLPAVGDSREFTHVMNQNAGKFRFRYRITRVANLERSIVIHLPPDFDPTPPQGITLQATVTVQGPLRQIQLTWAGASGANVDIYRNGVLSIVTANDGSHVDQVPPGTYVYRLCNAGSTTTCSPDTTVSAP